MAKVEPYPFWCSRCKCDHAGECEVTEPLAKRPVTILPVVGQVMYLMHSAPGLPWSKLMETTVTSVNHATGEIGLDGVVTVTAAWFRDEGVIDPVMPPGRRYRIEYPF